MEFEWDSKKAAANLRKHGIRFADAVSALEDEQAITIADDSIEEQRWVTLGADALGRILVVVYTWRADSARVPARRTAICGEPMKKEYDFGKGRRGAVAPIPSGKTRVTIRLDDDVLNWFREQVDEAGGGNYQSMINRVLRDFVDRSREPLESTLRRVIREELKRAG